MPGFQFNPEKHSLGLGRLRPTPSAVPAGGWKLAVGDPLRIKADQEAGRMLKFRANAGSTPPGGMAVLSPVAFNPSLAKMVPRAMGGVGAFGGRDQAQWNVSGANMYGQGLSSMANRNQLERNLDNDQVNRRLAFGAAASGRSAQPFQSFVGGSHPTHDMAQAYNEAYPSATRLSPTGIVGMAQPPATTMVHTSGGPHLTAGDQGNLQARSPHGCSNKGAARHLRPLPSRRWP